jgi:hypothetical protein
LWLAGGGFKKGYVHGATDDFSYKAVKDVVRVVDLQATLLHVLGLDHRRLTYPLACLGSGLFPRRGWIPKPRGSSPRGSPGAVAQHGVQRILGGPGWRVLSFGAPVSEVVAVHLSTLSLPNRSTAFNAKLRSFHGNGMFFHPPYGSR